MTAMNKDHGDSAVSRRGFMKGVAGLSIGFWMSKYLIDPAMASTGAARISFKNLHTNESFSGVYKVGDTYLPDAMARINDVLRDFRTGDVYPIDPKVIDLMRQIQLKMGRDGAFDIISGYRSPKTNAMLSQASTGVARKSLHMQGKAIDLRFPGYETAQIRRHAINLKAGGVGYYPKSNFVHIDTGRVRSWGG